MELPNRDVIIFAEEQDTQTVANPVAEGLRKSGRVVLVIATPPSGWMFYLMQVYTWARMVVFVVGKAAGREEPFLRQLENLDAAHTRPVLLAVLHELDAPVLSRCLTSVRIGAVPTSAGLGKIENLIQERLATLAR